MQQFNAIKVKQIDSGDLLAFLEEILGLTVGSSQATHVYDETFEGIVNVDGPFTVTGTSFFTGQATFHSGLISHSGVYVRGQISGESLAIDNFNLPSGSFTKATLGSVFLTGVPIFDSGNAVSGATLPSGTVFGIRQLFNAPPFERDASGQLMPTTGSGIHLITLCVSVGGY